ncbi:MAG TPA: hypothetical protein VGP56_13190 [Gaiellaceae bacterium]|nr:hypothetical protein [Gaiellaceae bacterium]
MSKAILTALMGFALSWHPTPARLGVSATEYHLTLSRPLVKAGVLEIELQNDGQDPHDLRLRRVGGTHTFSLPLTQPGKRRTLALQVRPGRYRLWCSIADHRALGMRTLLRVR